MSTNENPAEKTYQPGAIIALNIPREPIKGTRLQDEDGYICENVGPRANENERVCWVWKTEIGDSRHMTWREILDEANGPLTVLPPVFKVGYVITERAQLDLLPKYAVVLDDAKGMCQKVTHTEWAYPGVVVPRNSNWAVDLPATILWLPEDEEQA